MMKRLDKIVSEALDRLSALSHGARVEFLKDQKERFGGEIPLHEDIYIFGGIQDLCSKANSKIFPVSRPKSYDDWLRSLEARRPLDFRDLTLGELIRLFEAQGFILFRSRDHRINYHEDHVDHQLAIPGTNLGLIIYVYKDDYYSEDRRIFLSVSRSGSTLYSPDPDKFNTAAFGSKVTELSLIPNQDGTFISYYKVRGKYETIETVEDIVASVMGKIRGGARRDFESSKTKFEVASATLDELDRLTKTFAMKTKGPSKDEEPK